MAEPNLEEIVIEENEDGIILLIILNGVKPFQMGVTKISIINGNVYKLYAYQHTIFLSIHNTIALHILFRGSEYVPPKEELEKPLDINPKELHKQQGGI